jgi:dUTP pyrophosphatase
VRVEFKRLDPAAQLPRRARHGDAGLDLAANEDVMVRPGERALVGTGLASRRGLTLANAPGLIDAGYRGEVTVALVNLDPRKEVEVRRGDRIAQLLVVPFAEAEPVEVTELPASARGEGGFGSTGVR